MSLWFIAWSYLWNRKFTTFLTIFSVALAVGLISAVLTLRDETRKRFEEEAQAFDIVVGAKGSPLQMVLSSVYFMDQPTGNIDVAIYEHILEDPDDYIEAAYPINMGDSYSGFRIVGTNPDLFEHTWTSRFDEEPRHPFVISEGRFFEDDFEAVLGSLVALQTGLEVGDTFISTHGFMDIPEDLQLHDHSDVPYTVVGIMESSNSPFDRAIYSSLETVWLAHDDDHDHDHDHAHAHDDHDDDHAHDDHDNADDDAHDHGQREPAENPVLTLADSDSDSDAFLPDSQVTAVLVQLQSPGYRWQYKQYILENTIAMAAVPIEEINKLYNQFLSPVQTVLLAVGYLVVAISALSILIGLYLSILQRKRDLAIMRALGASSYEVFGAVLIEALLVTLLGIIGGWFLGNACTFVLSYYLESQFGLVITSFGLNEGELTAFATVAFMGMMAGILPAYQAYDSDVARDLASLQ